MRLRVHVGGCDVHECRPARKANAEQPEAPLPFPLSLVVLVAPTRRPRPFPRVSPGIVAGCVPPLGTCKSGGTWPWPCERMAKRKGKKISPRVFSLWRVRPRSIAATPESPTKSCAELASVPWWWYVLRVGVPKGGGEGQGTCFVGMRGSQNAGDVKAHEDIFESSRAPGGQPRCT